ncbi:MAG: response regulator [Candidatus Rokuibacteriota bacterium]
MIGLTPTDRPCVLVVEDDFGVRESLKLILEDGFEIIEAVNGAGGLRTFQSRRIDVVLLDLLLP